MVVVEEEEGGGGGQQQEEEEEELSLGQESCAVCRTHVRLLHSTSEMGLAGDCRVKERNVHRPPLTPRACTPNGKMAVSVAVDVDHALHRGCREAA